MSNTVVHEHRDFFFQDLKIGVENISQGNKFVSTDYIYLFS